jgi:hypothetical protein
MVSYKSTPSKQVVKLFALGVLLKLSTIFNTELVSKFFFELEIYTSFPTLSKSLALGHRHTTDQLIARGAFYLERIFLD